MLSKEIKRDHNESFLLGSKPQNRISTHPKNGQEIHFRTSTLHNNFFVKRTKINTLNFDKDGFGVKGFLKTVGTSKEIECLRVKCQKTSNIEGFSQRAVEENKQRKDFQKMIEGIKKLYSLGTIFIDFENCFEIKDSTLLTLVEGLKRLPHLRNIHLKFSSLDQITNEGVFQLFKGLKRLPWLQSLDLDFSKFSDDELDDLFFQKLTEGFQKLHRLQNIKIVFGNQWSRITDSSLFTVAEGLKRLLSLRSISFGFSGGDKQFTIKGIISLLGAFKELPLLQRIDLDLSGNPNLQNHSVQRISTVLESLPGLKSLDLDFSWNKENKMNKDALRSLGEALKKLKALQHFGLSIEGNLQTSDEGILSLGEGLRTLESLQSLALNLNESKKLTEKGLKNLLEDLEHLKILKSLKLSLSGCSKISDKGFSKLKENFRKLTSLNNFSLDYGSHNLYDEGLVHISDALDSFSELKRLELLLSSDKDKNGPITEKGLESLSKSLNRLTSLCTLALNFSGFLNSTDSGFDQLSRSLRPLVNLQIINFRFSLLKATDETLINMEKCLSCLPLLRDILLRFLDCEKITSKGMNYLIASLKNLNKLKKIHLAFWKPQLTNGSLCDVWQNLPGFCSSLESLTFVIGSCQTFDAPGIENMSEILKRFIFARKLQTIDILFASCNKISKASLREEGRKLRGYLPQSQVRIAGIS